MQLIVESLLNLGLPGIIIAALLVWVARLHSTIEHLHAERIADAKAFTERALALQEGAHQSIKKLETLADLMVRGAAGGSIHDG